VLEIIRIKPTLILGEIGAHMLLSVSKSYPRTKCAQTHKIISSARLPIVIFRSAPAVSPKSWEIRSVASVSVTDSGIIASRFQMKIIKAGALVFEMMIAASEKMAEKMTFILIISFVWALNIEVGLHDPLLP
jgi:hypothetical protein